MQKIFEKLPPDSLKQALLVRKQHLEASIASIEKELSHAPEGRLRISKNKGTSQYYLVKEKTKSPVENKTHRTFSKQEKNHIKNGNYISKTNNDLITALAQKDYNEKLLPVLKEQLDSVNNTLFIIIQNKIEKTFTNNSNQRKLLLEPVTLSQEEYINRWLKIEYLHKTFSPDSPEFFTAKGERVRSKTEIIIADTLNRLGIPYRYEYPLQIGKITIHPDFYCLNPKNRKEFIWEHFGMMDNPEYANATTEKLKLYQTNGFFPGDNLLITMETSESPINTRQIEEIVNKFLK